MYAGGYVSEYELRVNYRAQATLWLLVIFLGMAAVVHAEKSLYQPLPIPVTFSANYSSQCYPHRGEGDVNLHLEPLKVSSTWKTYLKVQGIHVRPLQVILNQDIFTYFINQQQTGLLDNDRRERYFDNPATIYCKKKFCVVARIKELAVAALNFKKSSIFHRDRQDAIIDKLMQTDCRVSNLQAVDIDLLAKKSEEIGSNPGLNLEGSYRYNNYPDQDDAYRQTAYAGLSWDILRSGWLENMSRSKIYDYEKQIAILHREKDELLHQERCRDMLLIKYFNILKIELLKKRQLLLDAYYTLMKNGYFQGVVLLDDLMKVEYECKKNRATIGNYEIQFPLSGEEMFPFNKHQFPPLLQININAIINNISTDLSFSKIENLKKSILDEKFGLLRDIRLRLYFQFGAVEKDYNYEYGRGRMGMQLTMPLFDGRDEERESEMNKIRHQQRREQSTRILEARRLYNAYGEKMNDAIEMEYKEQIVTERLRRSLLILEQNAYGNGVYDVARYLIELFDVRFEALAVQEGLYRRLLHLFSLSGVGYEKQFVFREGINVADLRARPGERIIYVWSETFNRMENEIILNIMQAKGISKILLSFSSKADAGKVRSFISSARDYGINVALMASANSWILPERRDNLKVFLQNSFALTSAVHLDIEPYTLPAYKKNPQKYVDWYSRMVQDIATQKQLGQTISISLPLHFARKVMKGIGRSVDRLYLMEYGQNRPEELIKKLRPFLRTVQPEVALVLRPTDFSSEEQLEMFIEKIIKETKIRIFAFHDLDSFVQMTGSWKKE